MKIEVILRDSALHPEGMAESSRGSEQSEDPRMTKPSCTHPGGMTESPRTTASFWHPFRMRNTPSRVPGVSTALRPPATLCHPFGMNHDGCKKLVGLNPPKIPDEPGFRGFQPVVQSLDLQGTAMWHLLGFRRKPPVRQTSANVLAELDPELLEALLLEFVVLCDVPGEPDVSDEPSPTTFVAPTDVEIWDGKTLRGTRTGDHRAE